MSEAVGRQHHWAERTIPALFARGVERYPDRPAVRNTRPVRDEPAEITYQELEDAAERLACGLHALGVRKGDRIALVARPRIRFAMSVLAGLRLGAWVVPLDPESTVEELTALLAHAAPKVILSTPDVLERLPRTDALRIDLDDVYDRPFVSVPTDEECRFEVPEEDDIAFLAYTSGTTGDPKGVLLTHGNIAADLANGTQVIPVFSDDVFLAIAPWHHILGLVACLILPWCGGAVAMYTDEFRRIPELLLEHRVSIFVGVPKLYHAMYDRIIHKVRSSFAGRTLWRVAPRVVGRRIKRELTGGRLRFFVSGSAPLDPRVALGLRRMGIGMMEGYGLTETSPVISVCDPFGRKAGSVGRPIPGMEARILAPADGVGELLVRGPIVMRGYYRNEAATRAAIDEDGWLHTGDLAAVDDAGEIFLKGRLKNMIVLDTGKKVYPEEVEWEFGRIPYVEDVLVRAGASGIEAVVYPNRERLEADGLVERARDALWEAMREAQTRLAPHKRLRSVAQLILVDRPFPKTSTLDIKRHLLGRGAAPSGG